VFEITKLVALAGGGRGRFEGGRRADWALGVHWALPPGVFSCKTRRDKGSRLIVSTDLPIDAVDQVSISDFWYSAKHACAKAERGALRRMINPRRAKV